MRKRSRRTILTSLALFAPLASLWETFAHILVQQKGMRISIPFGIDTRPMPKGTDINVLVPLTVGTFKRDPLPAATKPPVNEDLNVDYKSGADSVNLGFSIPETVKDAHEAIKMTRKEAIESKVSLKGEQYSIGTEPSFFHVGDFISWSRGRYFYYAKASSPAALEKFMRAFPF